MTLQQSDNILERKRIDVVRVMPQHGVSATAAGEP
jgi:hypothetical protein